MLFCIVTVILYYYCDICWCAKAKINKFSLSLSCIFKLNKKRFFVSMYVLLFRTYRPQAVQPVSNIRNRPMSSSQAQAGAAALARHEEKSKQAAKVVKPLVMSSKQRREVAEVRSI